MAWIPRFSLCGLLLAALLCAPLTAAAADKMQCFKTKKQNVRACKVDITSTPAPADGHNQPQATRDFTVVPNEVTRLVGWIEYDWMNCEPIDSGEWTVGVQPLRGATSTEIRMGSIGDCPGVQFPFNYMRYKWTAPASAPEKKDYFEATWRSQMFVNREKFNIAIAHVEVLGVDWNAGIINAKLWGRSGSSGVVEARFTGSPVNSPTFRSTSSEGPGTIELEFDRTEVRKAKYSELVVKWRTNPALEGKLTPSKPWNVLGNTRYSQYNVPHESACGATTGTYWIVDSLTTCNFTPVTLRVKFATQVHTNGTGVSLSHGTLKAGAATSMRNGTCSQNFPPGSTLEQLFLPVDSVTGSCNIALAANRSLAVYKKLGLKCNADVMLVNNANNTNFGARTREDTCPACNEGFNGTEGHIDHFTDTAACSGNTVGDLGNYWTVQTD